VIISGKVIHVEYVMPWWVGFKLEDKEDMMGNVLWREMDQQ